MASSRAPWTAEMTVTRRVASTVPKTAVWLVCSRVELMALWKAEQMAAMSAVLWVVTLAKMMDVQ